jgi:hypothetical protein
MERFYRTTKKTLVYFVGIISTILVFTQCSFKQHARESYAQAKLDKPYDVIIVPGVPYTDNGMVEVMKMRVFWAKHLYDSGYAKNIIFSGSSVYSPYVEGIVMKLMADSLGIPPEHTFAETKAEHSTENVYYSWKMAKRMGFKKIAVATDPFQAQLLKGFTEEYCKGVCMVPIMLGTMGIGNKQLPNINLTSAFVKDFVPLPKREGLWKRLKGTRGKRVKAEIDAEIKAEVKRKRMNQAASN